ncbi:hypothetical protein IAI10_16305 [Clostridium sp. 19966]|uniref:hypothetical protein n=1 Tax=Clostridium sp. 19966 TaxID=2768166 RepID=UPI0028DD91C4|nr:hypothetical protein [Clostridium sp. 19966]MDT8718230.1 hypothetical protein [Clostridium sp. 19966]
MKAVEEGTHGSVGIILTLGVITFFVAIFGLSGPLRTLASSNLKSTVQSFTASTFSNYDNTEINGSEVISAINTKASSDLSVIVKTKSDTVGKKYNTGSYNISDSSDPDYIEGEATFTSVLGKTTNGTIISITFTQQ